MSFPCPSRPQLTCSQGYGEAGVAKIIQLLNREIVTAMRLLGASRVSELKPEMVSFQLASITYCRLADNKPGRTGGLGPVSPSEVINNKHAVYTWYKGQYNRMNELLDQLIMKRQSWE